LSDSVYTKEWDEAVICIGDVLKFPDSRGFNARTVNGYTYLSPMPITDGKLIEQRLGQFLANFVGLPGESLIPVSGTRTFPKLPERR